LPWSSECSGWKKGQCSEVGSRHPSEDCSEAVLLTKKMVQGFSKAMKQVQFRASSAARLHTPFLGALESTEASPFLSLFHTVLELNHYNKYKNSWICLKSLIVDFSYHF